MERDKLILAELRDHSRWLKILAQKQLRESVKELSDLEKVIFEHSTEENSVRDIAKRVPVSRSAVSRMQRVLFRRGLLERVERYGGRYVRYVSLEDMGFEVPDLEVEEDDNE